MSSSAPAIQPSLLRTIVERIVIFGLFLLFCQTWFLDGFLRPYTITGPSMACTLLGEHRQVVCDDCGKTFFCDSSFRPVSPRAVCPNCGYAANDLESLPDLSGDRVLVDRSAFLLRFPRRWEVVAFRPPRRFDQVAVKRIVGLPGESVEIRHGDVYINGRIERKPLSVQRAMAISIDDANFVPQRLSSSPRWKGEKDGTRWKFSAGNFAYPRIGESQAARDELTSPEFDWLVYRHSRRLPGPEGQRETTLVEDTLTYNQNRPRRVESVHATSDLLLSFNLAKVVGAGKLFLRATDGEAIFHVVLDFKTHSFTVYQKGIQFLTPDNGYPLKEGMQIEASLFDRQFLFALNGRKVFSCPLDDRDEELPVTSEPFALSVEGLELAVEDLHVFRDVYYSKPIDQIASISTEKPVTLGEEEYYVLGDNSPLSEDSRTWSATEAVTFKSFLGKPLAIIYPTQSTTFFGHHFQIPDFNRIRYIR